MISEGDIISQIPFLQLAIPVWQMTLYVLIISACMLWERHKLVLITTYLFTLYWGFFFYFGQVIGSFGTWPNVATLFVICGLLHVALTLVAFLQEDSHAVAKDGEGSGAVSGAVEAL